jgi:HD-like signal output (HDOD) protein
LSSATEAPPEVAAIRSSEQLAAIEQLFTRVGEMAAPPSVAARVIDVTRDENADAQMLLDVVEKDPALAVRILRVVNSGYCAVRERVGDLKSAMTLLGFAQVRNLAMTGYAGQMFKRAGSYRSYSGAASRLIAKTCESVHPEEAYLAGLMHDVGLVLIDQYMGHHFKAILDKLDDRIDTTVVEQRTLTFDHTELGEFVVRKWNFPEQVAAAAGYHHMPTRYRGAHTGAVHVVSVANYLCSRRGVTSLGIANAFAPPDDVYTALQLDAARLAAILEQLDDTLEDAKLAATI